jgi:hypothetical protein
MTNNIWVTLSCMGWNKYIDRVIYLCVFNDVVCNYNHLKIKSTLIVDIYCFIYMCVIITIHGIFLTHNSVNDFL